MKMVKCKACGADIAKTANRCPNCGAKQHQIALTFASLIIVATVFAVVFVLFKDYDGPKGVTADQFNSIEIGMTYKDVCSVFGEKGSLLSETNFGAQEYATKIYSWDGRAPISNCNVTFQGGKVIAKAQFGLS